MFFDELASDDVAESAESEIFFWQNMDLQDRQMCALMMPLRSTCCSKHGLKVLK